MTKRIALALMLVAGTAGAASAQGTEATVAVTANVATIAEFNGLSRPLTFGVLTPGAGDVVVDEADLAAGAQQLGYAQFDFNVGGVQVDVDAPNVLDAVDGVSTGLTIAITCAEAAADGSDLSGMLPCGSHNLVYSGSGVETRAIWLGGTIADADLLGATAGDYDGEITLTIVP